MLVIKPYFIATRDKIYRGLKGRDVVIPGFEFLRFFAYHPLEYNPKTLNMEFTTNLWMLYDKKTGLPLSATRAKKIRESIESCIIYCKKREITEQKYIMHQKDGVNWVLKTKEIENLKNRQKLELATLNGAAKVEPVSKISRSQRVPRVRVTRNRKRKTQKSIRYGKEQEN